MVYKNYYTTRASTRRKRSDYAPRPGSDSGDFNALLWTLIYSTSQVHHKIDWRKNCNDIPATLIRRGNNRMRVRVKKPELNQRNRYGMI